VSTYYALVREQCSDATDFVSRGDIFTWMADALTEVPKFLGRHADHLSTIRILSEFDRWPSGDERYDWRKERQE
jgi:hypothetical protein